MIHCGRRVRLSLASQGLLLLGLVAAAPISAADSSVGVTAQPSVVAQSLHNDVSRPLRSIALVTGSAASDQVISLHDQLRGAATRLADTLTTPLLPFTALTDPVLQQSGGVRPMPGTVVNFDGLTNLDGVLPPDTNGDVGPNHYVQVVNVHVAIWDKSGNLQYGPQRLDQLWQGFAGICGTTANLSSFLEASGDPIVQYDQLADHWLIAQTRANSLGGSIIDNFHECIAISQTGDPTGQWYRYDFPISTSKLNDGPKFGVWPDAYYMTMNQFTGAQIPSGQGVVAFERTKMLSGQAAGVQILDLYSVDPTLWGMLPADLDGPTPPPAGSPGYFIEADDDVAGFASDQLRVFQFHVDWATPANSTFTHTQTVDLSSAGLQFTSSLCFYSRNCIPQLGTTQRLDALTGDLTPESHAALMYRLAYRSFADHQTLVMNHTVDVDGSDHAGIRWYELRMAPGAGTPVALFQAGTYGGDTPDSAHRWAGSIAMDGSGNLALGYSVSSSTMYPSIRYVGRFASDPLSELPQSEAELIAGSGAQTSSLSRWGDYSALVIDPTDDHTFWYTQEYYDTTSERSWKTRIGAFRMMSSAGAVSLDRSAYTCSASAGIQVTDVNLMGTGTVTVTVSTASDSESLSLTETPSGSGIFLGAVAIGGGAVTKNDGTLQVTDGDTITATYEDADSGNGSPASVHATAAVQCLPPTIADLNVINIAALQATVTFDTNRNSTADVRYGTSCGSLTSVQSDAVLNTGHQITLTGLTTLTKYFFAIVVTDALGNTKTDDNAGACYSFTTTGCGNGVVDVGEQCEDGTVVGGDGCSAACTIEFGWTCTPEVPTHCTLLSPFVPPTIKASSCEQAVGHNGLRLNRCLISCEKKAAQATRFGRSFAEQTCEDSCVAAYTKFATRLVKIGCPACLGSERQGALAAQLRVNATQTETAIYCAVPDRKTLGCEQTVAANTANLTNCVQLCKLKAANAAAHGKAFDEQACEIISMCRPRYDSVATALAQAGSCPACLGPVQQKGLADQVIHVMSLLDGGFYCAGTQPLP